MMPLRMLCFGYNLIRTARGETLALSGTGSFTSSNVGSGKTVTLNTLAISNGTGLTPITHYQGAPISLP